MAGIMAAYPPDSPMEPEDAIYPCKGCGEILEEGKAFELASHRWHLECFKCNTCGTILDSDANLLLLGDGSLICNNCTYSCSACGNKIQDLAILTGDQAYCAGCFRCRNCKKKIENLRYARTSQGMFCMECHDALMARRRKKTKSANQRLKQQGSHMLLDKSLPSLPPSAVVDSSAFSESSTFSPETDRGGFSGPSTPTELPGSDVPSRRLLVPRPAVHELASAPIPELDGSSSLAAPDGQPSHRTSAQSDGSDNADGFMIPINLDPSLVDVAPPVGDLPQELSADKENTPLGAGPGYPDQKQDIVQSQPPEPKTAIAPLGLDPHISAQNSPRGGSFNDSARNPNEPRPSRSETRLDVLNNAASPRVSAERSRDPSPLVPKQEVEKEAFQLQDAPPSRRKSVSAKDTIFSGPPRAGEGDGSRRPLLADQTQFGSSTSVRSDASSTQMASHPKRGDSLQAGKANSQQVIQRKEVGSGRSASGQSGGIDSPSSAYLPSPGLNGSLVAKPADSPATKNLLDFPPKSERRQISGGSAADSYSSPRVAPAAPETASRHQRKASLSQPPGKAQGPPDISPSLTRVASDTTDDRVEVEQEQSFLKRVSNSVRHARTNSDRVALRGSRDNKGIWPKSPLTASATAELLAGISPSIGSPESAHKDVEYYKSQLQLQRQRNAEQEKHIAELKEMIEGPKITIKQMNTELREKRSTMVVLDTQKEIVVRELELLQPMAAAKKSGEAPDMSKKTPAALKDFAAALQKLKDQFAPDIEELMEKKTSVQEDIARLTRERDRLQQEFDQLSLVNQRLIDATNENANARIAEQAHAQSQQNQGLGIYGGASNDRFKDTRPQSSDTHATGSTLIQDLGQEEPVIVTPKVINVHKNKGNKFTWKKGGMVAKTVGKGLKDAFSSDRSQGYEGQGPGQNGGVYGAPQSLEGTPYGATQSGNYPSTTLPKNYKIGAEGIEQQQQNGSRGQIQAPGGRSTPQQQISKFGEPIEPPHKLYGSMLQARADFEGVDIPSIVVRCVQEVQSRGMDVEGIYRKSGGSGQINEIKAGFEKSNDYDISDVDLDIHAVTSSLKQYFRKLPNPLITFEVYDKLIATAPRAPVQQMMGGGIKGGENGGAVELMSKEERIKKTREALSGLPMAHGATLSFLIFHLAKIRREEGRNLMHSTNLAVVFAPTIMRPVEIAREMLDTPGKNDCIRFMIENCEDLFLRG